MAYNYQKEIAEAGVVNVVPSYASLNEAYFYIQEATEEDWNNMMQSIGVFELGVLEATGSEVIYEENDESGETKNTEAGEEKKNKLVEFVKQAWARIKGVFDDLLGRLSSAIKEARDKLNSKFGGKLESRIMAWADHESQSKEKKVFGKIYLYKRLDEETGKEFGEGSSYFVQTGEGTKYDTKDAFINALRGDGSGKEPEKVEIDIAWLKDSANLKKLINYATDFKITKGSIVKSYNTSKKTFDGQIKAAKEAKNKEDIDKIKEKITFLNKYASACVRAFHERQASYLGVLTKVAVAVVGKTSEEKANAKSEKELAKANKAAEKEALKNAGGKEKEPLAASAIDSTGTPVVESYAERIEKLFDWDF